MELRDRQAEPSRSRASQALGCKRTNVSGFKVSPPSAPTCPPTPSNFGMFQDTQTSPAEKDFPHVDDSEKVPQAL